MGEKQNQPFQLLVNASLKVDFQGSRVTSNGGLILIRELDERLGLEKLIEEQLSDSRQGLNKQFTLADLLRQSVYSRLAGYEDLNDAERLAADPTFQPLWGFLAAKLGRIENAAAISKSAVFFFAGTALRPWLPWLVLRYHK